MFLAYLIAFVLIPGSLGAIAAILVANYFPRRRKTVLSLLIAMSLGVFVVLAAQVSRPPAIL